MSRGSSRLRTRSPMVWVLIAKLKLRPKGGDFSDGGNTPGPRSVFSPGASPRKRLRQLSPRCHPCPPPDRRPRASTASPTATGKSSRSTGSTSKCGRVRCWRCWARTAPGRPPRSACSSAPSRSRRGPRGCSGAPPDAAEVRLRRGAMLQVSGVPGHPHRRRAPGALSGVLPGAAADGAAAGDGGSWRTPRPAVREALRRAEAAGDVRARDGGESRAGVPRRADRRASTSTDAAVSGTRSGGSRRRGAPPCSRRTTSRRRTPSPTGSP